VFTRSLASPANPGRVQPKAGSIALFHRYPASLLGARLDRQRGIEPRVPAAGEIPSDLRETLAQTRRKILHKGAKTGADRKGKIAKVLISKEWHAFCIRLMEFRIFGSGDLSMPKLTSAFSAFAVTIAAGLGLMAAGPAKADVITLQLTSDHCTGGCLGGLTSLGTVTVNDTGGKLAFSIDLTSSNSGIVNTGFDGSFAFDLNGDPVITYSNIVATGGAGFTPVGGNTTGAQNLTKFDGFGSFEYAILRDQQGGGALPTVTNLSFTISDAANDLTLASLQQTSFQGGSTFFVVDAISGQTGNTGLVDAGTPSRNVPEPASLAIFGTALASLGLIGLRRRRKDNV